MAKKKIPDLLVAILVFSAVVLVLVLAKIILKVE